MVGWVKRKRNPSKSLIILILVLTSLAIISRENALKLSAKLLERNRADEELIILSSRKNILIPTPPPGSNKIVTTRAI
jgi:hypothetical protein